MLGIGILIYQKKIEYWLGIIKNIIIGEYLYLKEITILVNVAGKWEET